MNDVDASERGGRREAMLAGSGPSEDDRLARFEALFRRDADTVLAYAMRRSDADAAHDVVAETFAVAWRRLDAVPDPALPWLLGVARKVLANQRRGRARADELNLRLVREPVETSDDPADVVDARLSARAALDGLAPNERELLELIAWEGLTPAQAAETLGCSRVAIAVRMHRARRRFLALLEEPGRRAEPALHPAADVEREPGGPAPQRPDARARQGGS